MGGYPKVRVGIPAMLGEVQAFQFFFRGYPKTHNGIDGFEHDKGGGKGPDKAGADAKELNPNDGCGRAAHIEYPGTQCAPGTAYAVNTDGAHRIIHFDFVKKEYGKNHHSPCNSSDDNGAVGDTLAQPAVMPTRPARAPFKLMPTSGFPNLIHEINMAKIAPAAAARLVLTKIMAILLSAVVVEPGLKPNQPSQRINTPRAARGIL